MGKRTLTASRSCHMLQTLCERTSGKRFHLLKRSWDGCMHRGARRVQEEAGGGLHPVAAHNMISWYISF